MARRSTGGFGRVGGGCVRAADPGAASGVSADALDGDRGADWLAVFDPHVEREGGGAAAVVSAAGSGQPARHAAGHVMPPSSLRGRPGRWRGSDLSLTLPTVNHLTC